MERIYRINLDNYGVNVCSNDHARLAITRWNEKKKLGIKPGMPKPPNTSDEMLGDNMQEISEGGDE